MVRRSADWTNTDDVRRDVLRCRVDILGTQPDIGKLDGFYGRSEKREDLENANFVTKISKIR